MIDYKAVLGTLTKDELIEGIMQLRSPHILSMLATKAQDKYDAKLTKILDKMDELSNSNKAMDHIKWMELNEEYKKLEEKWDKLWGD